MKQKYIIVPFEGGYAQLHFTRDSASENWVCVMPPQTMNDLQAYMNGETPREHVGPYIDGKGLWD